MRSLLFIVAGTGLWLMIHTLVKVIDPQVGNGWIPTVAFAIIWFFIAGWNMWVGVTQAGYTVMEELPIFLLIYIVPVAIAGLIKAKLH
ncbi:MAG: hypothetical protein JAY67_17485 [Candidatus Thiodiazotropha taylori]|nr:hypothetical protein [Shewanella sp.]MCG7894652.1 hypothetical protein [Candidatus Thiodiazotropha taylori]MCG7912177.1 hypothetical protein [Candidatus Thiodiazotropha taylori]MCG7927315.1 hypothetical protein [Candidatus Thiodiazotropha taylori]MCG7997269.1 hypothetical protein [Candidatus Thiodiazotropha taylori]